MITFHRSFIHLMHTNPGPEPTTSFAICKNAARSLANVVHTYVTRFVSLSCLGNLMVDTPHLDSPTCRCSKDAGEPWLFLGGFHAAVILAVDYWGGGGTQRGDIERCIETIAACENK